MTPLFGLPSLATSNGVGDAQAATYRQLIRTGRQSRDAERHTRIPIAEGGSVQAPPSASLKLLD